MWILLLLSSGTLAGPTQGPLLALIPAGTSVNMTWEGKPPSVFGVAGSLNDPRIYRRFEFLFLDYQVNQTDPTPNELTFNFDIFANVTFGQHPQTENAENFTDAGDGSSFSAFPPATTDGFTPLFNGFYNAGVGKVNIDRTMTSDTCGLDQDSGYLEMWVRPTSGQTFTDGAPEGYFFCLFNVTTGADLVQEPDAQWGTVLQCKSSSFNNYHHRLWYKVRYYNIDPKICQTGNPRIF